MGKRLSKSIRKYIRKEKARIKREVLDLEEQKRQLEALLEKFKEQINIEGGQNDFSNNKRGSGKKN